MENYNWKIIDFQSCLSSIFQSLGDYLQPCQVSWRYQNLHNFSEFFRGKQNFSLSLLSLVCARMSSICHWHVLGCHPYVTRVHLCAICMLLVCTRMSSACHLGVLVCHPHVTRTSSVCHSYVIVCHPYVTLMYLYVIRISLECSLRSPICHWYVTCISLFCTLMSSVCHSSVVLPWTAEKHDIQFSQHKLVNG